MLSQTHIAALPQKLRRMQQPVIAAVNGPAYGGGFALALACDLRVASPQARFCSQFIKVGVGGCDLGISYTLPRIVGGGRATELITTARVFDAAEAERIGFVTRLVPADDLQGAALDLAETLCANSPFALEMTKQVLIANADAAGLDQAIALENRTQILAGTGGEFTEAVTAFAERRAPSWVDRPADHARGTTHREP